MNKDIQVRGESGNIEQYDGSTAGDIIAQGGTMQKMQTQFATAVTVQKPRPGLLSILRNVEEEAFISGEEFYYSWTVRNKNTGREEVIEGPSVKLANALARIYGNCVVQHLPIQETRDSWIFTAAFVDLETGFTNMRPFRQSKKWQVFGNMDADRKDDVRFQIGCSKASRNVLVNSVPPILIKKAMERAKAGVREKIEEYVKKNGLQKAIDLILKELAKVGVSAEMVSNKIRKKIAVMDIDDIVLLRGDLQTLQDGGDTIDNVFPSQEDNKPQDTAPKVGLKPKRQPKAPDPEAKPEPEPEAEPEEPPDISAARKLEDVHADITNIFEVMLETNNVDFIESSFKSVCKETIGKEIKTLTALNDAGEAEKVLAEMKKRFLTQDDLPLE